MTCIQFRRTQSEERSSLRVSLSSIYSTETWMDGTECYYLYLTLGQEAMIASFAEAESAAAALSGTVASSLLASAIA